MPKRAFIIHGWGGRPDEHWLPWLAAELTKQGFAVTMPAMPNTNKPTIEAWVGELKAVVGEPDEQTYFVGHSIGCQTIMRFLATQGGKKTGGCIFVAGWLQLENLSVEEIPIAEPWLTDDIDFKTVRSTTKKFLVINSSNDDYGAVETNKRLFVEKLGATVKILTNKGHFTAADGVTTLPEALAALSSW